MSTRGSVNRRIGLFGEQFAKQYLERSLGWKIWKSNYRCVCGEIDLAAVNGTGLVIVEVKTRQQTRFGHPLEAVDYRKLNRLKRVVVTLLQEPRDEFPAFSYIRFDLIALLVQNDRVHQFWHIPNLE